MSKIEKLGMGIIAFEGTEHIKNITTEVRPYVKEIVVCLQNVSYTGRNIDKYDIDEVNRCLECGLIDKIVWYDYNDSDIERAKEHSEREEDWPRYLEMEKRNKLLDVLEQDGCSHAIITDSDEYYDGNEFANALRYYDSEDTIKVTYCQYINYWKDYRHYLIWPFNTYVPFISDIKYRFGFSVGLSGHAVDKTRVYSMKEGEQYSILNWNVVKMHHLSWIRLNIEKKIRSWSSIKYFTENELKVVIDKFYKWKPYENAYVTFRTPLAPMCVVDMGRQYIKPKYALFEKPIKWQR